MQMILPRLKHWPRGTVMLHSSRHHSQGCLYTLRHREIYWNLVSQFTSSFYIQFMDYPVAPKFDVLVLLKELISMATLTYFFDVTVVEDWRESRI